jgi:hypothetical protein
MQQLIGSHFIPQYRGRFLYKMLLKPIKIYNFKILK